MKQGDNMKHFWMFDTDCITQNKIVENMKRTVVHNYVDFVN